MLSFRPLHHPPLRRLPCRWRAVSARARRVCASTPAPTKCVYFAFGFEAINNAANRAAIMERALAWLNGTSPRPVLLAPRNGQAVPTGDIDFTWIGVPGVTRYEIQIDTVETFDSPELIDVTVSATSYKHDFDAHGTRYWRVRALPDGGQPGAWTFPLDFLHCR